MYTGPTFTPAIGPPNDGYTQMLDYAGGNTVVYTGLARSRRILPQLLVVSSVTAASPTVINSTAHGLATDNTVVIVNGSGNWAGLNGTRKITVIDANSFSVAVDSSAYAGSFDGQIMTYAPQTSKPIWAIQKLYYDANGTSVISTKYAKGQSGESQIWDNRASLDYA